MVRFKETFFQQEQDKYSQTFKLLVMTHYLFTVTSDDQGKTFNVLYNKIQLLKMSTMRTELEIFVLNLVLCLWVVSYFLMYNATKSVQISSTRILSLGSKNRYTIAIPPV